MKNKKIILGICLLLTIGLVLGGAEQAQANDEIYEVLNKFFAGVQALDSEKVEATMTANAISMGQYLLEELDEMKTEAEAGNIEVEKYVMSDSNLLIGDKLAKGQVLISSIMTFYGEKEVYEYVEDVSLIRKDDDKWYIDEFGLFY